jgi:CRP-like cAMP-binding protein
MDETDRQAVLDIARRIAPLDADAFAPVLGAMRCADHAAGDAVIAEGDIGPGEYFVLEGILKTFVGDAEGREVTLAFHVGPCAMTPAICREAEGRSRVGCVALTPARVAAFPAATLVACMVAQPSVQCWGDAVLRGELVRRADREWALAALPAAERLVRFRREHPGLEDRIAHHHIASYLGVTPVTLSRLRSQARN